MQYYLRIGPQRWGWVVGAFALGYALFDIPGGWMGDRFGPRIILTRIVLWWSAFTALTGAVSSYPLLLLTRLMFGAGEAGAFPNSCVAISRWFPTGERDPGSFRRTLLSARGSSHAGVSQRGR